MAKIKTVEEIQALREGGALLSRALKSAIDAVKPGVTLRELNAIGERVIREGGGEPSFLGYKTGPNVPPFPSTICISVNDEIVHGLGNRELPLEEGDIVGLDIGCWYKGLCTDMAVTVPVGRVPTDAMELMAVTKQSLLDAVAAVHVGGTIADVGRAVEMTVKPHGYGIVRALVGHGVGHAVHEAPSVPNFFDKRSEKIQIEENMVLALEPMLGLGDSQVETADDGWAVRMADGKLGAHFEVTIAVLKDGPEILTPLPV